jgi:regulator of sigma E protease
MSFDFLSSLLGSAWSIFLIVLFFGGSIFVHELGHFLAARRRGVKVTRFSIGFGPAIWKWQGKDGVDYRISWLPLGGYVALPQLADMPALEGESENVEQLPPVDYTSRMIVFVAGAACNILFAFALACVLWWAGQPTSEDLSTTRIGYVTKTITLPDNTSVPSPALEAGLQVGDTIRAIDGTQVADWSELLQTLVTSAGVTDDGQRKAIFTIEREGRLLDLPVHPRLSGEEKNRKVGIMPAYTPIVNGVPEKSYAQQLGLQVDDQLKTLNGAPLLNLVTLMDMMQAKVPEAFTLGVLRGDRTITIQVPADRPKNTSPYFGAAYRTNYGLVHVNPFEQVYTQIRMTVRMFVSLLQPNSDMGLSKLSGPVGIGRIYWDASKAGIRYVVWIAILVNVNLAIFNLLPIPVLDGGHMLFATIGKLRGKALPFNFVATMQSIFVVLILGMMAYVTVFGDLRRLVRDNRAETLAKEAAAEAQKQSAEPAKP